MELNSPFEQILDSDEYIQKIFKPNKLKMYLSSFLASLFLFLWLAIIFVGIELTDAESTDLWWVGLVISVAIWVVFLLFMWLFLVLSYKNTFYAYTNKRIVIRRGIFGVDFKSLDMNMVGAITVNVTLLDKILRKGTGTIVFGSMASPIANNGMYFRFANISNIYDRYKEIKSVIDEQKNTQKSPINS